MASSPIIPSAASAAASRLVIAVAVAFAFAFAGGVPTVVALLHHPSSMPPIASPSSFRFAIPGRAAARPLAAAAAAGAAAGASSPRADFASPPSSSSEVVDAGAAAASSSASASAAAATASDPLMYETSEFYRRTIDDDGSRPRYGQPSPSTPSLRRLQDRADFISSSFVPSTFDPHPLLTNNHLQTISGVFVRDRPECAYVTDGGLGGWIGAVGGLIDAVSRGKGAKEGRGSRCDYYDERETIETPDGDFFHVDRKYVGDGRVAKGLVVALHGLESNANATLSVDIAEAHRRNGFDVAYINFRGKSGVPNRTPGGYHLGFTDDLIHYLRVLKERDEKERGGGDGEDGTTRRRPIYLTGYSLGSNVVLKALGELGERAHLRYNVRGASVSDVPFDVERNNPCFEAPGFNRAVYSDNFLKTLKVRAREQLDLFCDGDEGTDLFDYVTARDAETVADFETAYIARVYGFDDNVDYYRCTSCGYFLEGIGVPTLVLNSADDPFMDPNHWPVEKTREGGGPAPIRMIRTERGGHSAFVFHRPGPNDMAAAAMA
eukprot:CAMPEP_0183303456 /NCGR_PEP_ID=MMETSP0160_2-20130417/8889_1 /TAXON_ID=2839 ORGANISM="Odontella Sinensis, Strain Grunow 1884" /NCGR_SAMPLE_ID=MMETSP0160_2 /ASSEMBLY_ACC=CAM_ASM_000250 /LENGTH=548 /DNA_ID=CAMNT_0025466363 /DNA_START=212 /DNA_END=1855 /DNA_ORIENTATION=-